MTIAVSKSKLRESFGDEWAQARVTGILLRKGANKKWTNLKDTEDMEYGYNHKVFVNPLSPLCMKGRKPVVVSPLASLAAGAVATVSKDIEDILLAVSSPSTDQSASKARLDELSIHDQTDILSASKHAEVSGMKRKRAHDEFEQDENPRKERPKNPRKEKPECSHGKQKLGVRRFGILQPRQTKGAVQGVRRLCILQARQTKGVLQRECGGSGICSHGKRKAHCKEC